MAYIASMRAQRRAVNGIGPAVDIASRWGAPSAGPSAHALPHNRNVNAQDKDDADEQTAIAERLMHAQRGAQSRAAFQSQQENGDSRTSSCGSWASICACLKSPANHVDGWVT
jgi:hypothetical protein